MNKTIMVIAAHPDDEVLGCGGTMARHIVDGDKVHVIFMSDGVTSRIHVNDEEVKERKQAAINASNTLGIKNKPIFLGFPDNRMDAVALLDIVQSLEEIIHEIKPEVIYTHHVGDLNIDHQITHQAVMTACRPKPEFCVREIYSFEVLSSTEWAINNPFIPNYFIDITSTLKLKFLALESYTMEILDYPNSRSMKGVNYLAKRRGLEVGVNAAECFIAERIIR